MKSKKVDLEKQNNESKVSADAVVFVEIDEEITTIFDRIKNIKNAEVYIVVPERSILLQNIINLKILKRKVTEIEKELNLITTDEIGIGFANEIGLSVYLNLQLEPVVDKSSANQSMADDADFGEQLVGKIRGEDELPTRRSEAKVSIAELQHKRRIKDFTNVVQDWKKIWRQIRQQSQKRSIFWQSPKRKAIIMATFISVFVLFFVAYIALPQATIYITPNQQTIEQAINITLVDAEKNSGLLRSRPRRTIASFPVAAPELMHTITYTTLGRNFEGQNAQGTLNIINTADRTWTFVPKTQFQTDNGIIFRTTDYVNVPAGTIQNPAKIPVNVVADPFDANGNPIGDRGNIGPSKLSIVKLGDGYKELVYGENTQAMTGGKTVTSIKVTEDDIKRASEFAKEKALADLPGLLQSYLDTSSEYKNERLKLLNVPNSIIFEEPQIIIDPSLVGTATPEFPVIVKIKAQGIAFNEGEMQNLIQDELLLRQTPNKEIAQIDESGLAYRVVSRNDEAGIVELTVSIKGVEKFDLDPQKRSGADLIQRIKDESVALKISDAEKVIGSMPEVESVKIDSSPFWTPTLPNISDNINVVIQN